MSTSLSCGGSLTPVGLEVALGSPEAAILRIGPAALHVEAYPLEQDLLTESRLVLDDRDVLQFFAVVQADPSGDTRCELFASDGDPETQDAEVLLGSWPVLELKALNEEAATAPQPVTPRVDLSGYRGVAFGLRWHLTSSFKEGSAVILLPQLTAADRPKPPDILFVCSDTHRYDFACGREVKSSMPNLTAFSDRALVYDSAWSTASWTLPSITSTLTGLFPRNHRTGLRSPEVQSRLGENDEVPAGYFGAKMAKDGALLTAYPKELPTLTERLREVGYSTAMIVSNPLYVTSTLHGDGQDLSLNMGVVRGAEVNAAARKVLKLCPSRAPIFLMVHYMDVHQWQPWFYDQVNGSRPPKENLLATQEAYRAAVRATDDSFGELLDIWDARVGTADSFVTFYSDHGESLFDDGHIGHGNSMTEQLLHVPLVVQFPKRMGIAPARIDDPVSLVDLYPTILHMLNTSSGASHLDGRSLLEASDEPRPLFADYQLYLHELSSLRFGTSKLIIDHDQGSQVLKTIGAGPEGTQATRTDLMAHYQKYVADSDELTANLRSRAWVDQAAAAQALDDLGYFAAEDEGEDPEKTDEE